jgi:hypothetical protein
MSKNRPSPIWKRRLLRGANSFLFCLLILTSAVSIEMHKIRENELLQTAREISLLLFQYADDHDGKYPEGKTSTEVFQKLIDAGYDKDSDGYKIKKIAALFYVPMPGKVAPTSKDLKPQNVCWDVTSRADVDLRPPKLPVLFLTGYQINYVPGAKAVPRARAVRSWSDWWMNFDYPRDFIVVEYWNDNRRVLNADTDGTIPEVIPEDFDSRGKAYHQLTPDGSLR